MLVAALCLFYCFTLDRTGAFYQGTGKQEINDNNTKTIIIKKTTTDACSLAEAQPSAQSVQVFHGSNVFEKKKKSILSSQYVSFLYPKRNG